MRFSSGIGCRNPISFDRKLSDRNDPPGSELPETKSQNSLSERRSGIVDCAAAGAASSARKARRRITVGIDNLPEYQYNVAPDWYVWTGVPFRWLFRRHPRTDTWS